MHAARVFGCSVLWWLPVLYGVVSITQAISCIVDDELVQQLKVTWQDELAKSAHHFSFDAALPFLQVNIYSCIHTERCAVHL